MPLPSLAPFVASFHSTEGLVSMLIEILIGTLLVYFAAKFVLGRSSLIASILTAVLAGLLAGIAAGLIGEPSWLRLVVYIAVWSLLTAIFFRTAWVRGAIIGLVAAVLLWLVNLVIGLLF